MLRLPKNLSFRDQSADWSWESVLFLCRIQHIFDKNAIAHGGIVDKDMGHGTDQLPVLDNRTATHADVK